MGQTHSGWMVFLGELADGEAQFECAQSLGLFSLTTFTPSYPHSPSRLMTSNAVYSS